MAYPKTVALAGFSILTASLWLYFVMASDPVPIKIGYIGSLTGKYAALGTSGRDGAILAVEEINKAGGILSTRPIQLVIRDDGFSPEASASAAQELAQEQVQAVIGPFATASALAVVPTINRERMVTIGPVIAGDEVHGQDDFFFTLFPSSRTIGAELGRIATHKLGLRKITIVADANNKAYSDSIIQGFTAAYPNRGEDVRTMYIHSGFTSDLSTTARDCLSSRPDGILITASALDTAMFCQQIRKIDTETRILSAPWGVSGELIQSGGRAVEGLFYIVPYDLSSRIDTYRVFVERFKTRFGGASPTFASLFNYEAVHLLADVLSQNPSSTSSDLKRMILMQRRFQGLQGEYEINENGDSLRRLIPHTIKDSTFVKAE